MRILSITAGAAGMYCGSCLRDNSLAAELVARGEDVTLLPIYTPTRTDEPNVSGPRVLFGGISVYLQQQSAFFRHTPPFLDRLWDAPWVIGAFANRAASTDAKLLGDMAVSMLQGEQGVLKKEFEKLVTWVRDEPLPDVINLPNSLLIGLAAPLKKAFARPICCTLQGEELFLDGLEPRFRAESLRLIRAQVPMVDRFIAVSEACAVHMGALLEIPAARMSVVPLGIQMAGYERHEPGADLFRVGYFARVAPEKGLHVLAEAYVRFRRRASAAKARLDVAGYMSSAHAPYLASARAVLEQAGLGGEFSYRGEVDRAGKVAFLSSVDVLSVPAIYDEPKGIFLLEAMASGVPVVQPRRGAFIEVVEKTGGGLLVDVADPEALADGLFALWSDVPRRRELGRRAYDGVRMHYAITKSAARLLDVYREVRASGSATQPAA
jgi:glycosyltransferase involved in cell wall biosynthesis